MGALPRRPTVTLRVMRRNVAGPAEARDGPALLDPDHVDVRTADPLPRHPGEPPPLDLCRLAAAGVPVGAVRFVAQGAGDPVGRLVVDKGVTAGLTCAQSGEGQLQDRRPHLLAQSPSAAARGQPREAGHGAEPGEVRADQILHADRFAVDEHGEVQPPRIRAHPGPAGPDAAQPSPFAFRIVGVERHGVVERPRRRVGDPRPHQRHETFQQVVGRTGQRQAWRADLDVQRGIGVGHARTLARPRVQSHPVLLSRVR